MQSNIQLEDPSAVASACALYCWFINVYMDILYQCNVKSTWFFTIQRWALWSGVRQASNCSSCKRDIKKIHFIIVFVLRVEYFNLLINIPFINLFKNWLLSLQIDSDLYIKLYKIYLWKFHVQFNFFLIPALMDSTLF